MNGSTNSIVAFITAATATITAVTALIIQLRKFRREIVHSVEQHMEMTLANHRLLLENRQTLRDNAEEDRK